MGVKCQINEFGQCPKQVFKIPHPARGALTVLNSVPPLLPAEPFDDDKDSRDNKDKEVQVERKAPLTKVAEISSLYSESGKPKVKTLLSMGKMTDIKFNEIPKAHKMPITRMLSLTSKPNTIVSIGQDGFLKVFDLVERACQKSFKICEFCLSSIVPIKGDEIFAIGSWDNSIYLFNIVYGSKSKPVLAHDNSVSDLVFLPKRKRLVSSSWDCSIKLWRIVGNNIEAADIFQDHDNQINCLGVDANE
jgi:factor associated with neutral sphingomyelinase activation